MKKHLNPVKSDRGFSQLPSIPSTYGGEIRVAESSAADGPHIWLFGECPVNLNDRNGEAAEISLHLTQEDAYKLAEQLFMLCHRHYQNW